MYTGPIPPPEALARYNDAVPNGAERILAVFEKQSAHRQDIERTVIANDVVMARAGLVTGVIVALSIVFLAGYIVHTGVPQAAPSAAAIVGIDLASVVGAFIYGRRKNAEELARKMPSSR